MTREQINLELIRAYKAEGLSKQDKNKIAGILVTENGALITRAIQTYAPQYLGTSLFDDLYQVASLAIVKSIPEYDEKKGKFSTFFMTKMRGAIGEEVSCNIRGSSVHYDMYAGRIRKAIDELAAQGITNYDVRELSEYTGISASTISVVLNSEGLTMQASIEEGEIDPMDNDCNVEEAVIRKIDKENIERALYTLPNDMKLCVKLSFGIGCNEMSKAQIADALNKNAGLNPDAKNRDVLGHIVKKPYSPFLVEKLLNDALYRLRDHPALQQYNSFRNFELESGLDDFHFAFEVPAIEEEIEFVIGLDDDIIPSA